MSEKIEVAIIDDDINFQEEVYLNLQMNPLISRIDKFSTAELWWRNRKRDEYSYLFLDISLPDMNGIDMLCMIKEKKLKCRVIIMSTIVTEDIIVKALKFGAIGYIWKSDIADVNEVLNVIHQGGAYISPTVALKVLKSFQTDDTKKEDCDLTLREKQVLQIIITGSNAEECAKLCDISINTVRKHIRNIYEKLNVCNRVEMMNKAKEIEFF